MIGRLVVVVPLFVGLALIAACQSTPDAASGGDDADPLRGTSWRLASMERDGNAIELPADARPPTVTFRAEPAENGETQLGGFGGINQYFGSYTAAADGALTVGVLGMTMMAGPPEIMDLERDFTALLQAATSFEIADVDLVVRGDVGTMRLVAE